ncbi:MAG: hypothetical protein V3T55_06275, partial [Anaerolineales bacterium]
SKYKPDTKETADHSLPYVIAAAVVDGNVLPESFEEHKLRDPDIRATLQKIKVIADPEIDALFPNVKRASVTITLQDGSKHSAQTDYAKGSPEDPMSDNDLFAKFRANAHKTMSEERITDIIEQTMSFESVSTLEPYMNLLVSEKT